MSIWIVTVGTALDRAIVGVADSAPGADVLAARAAASAELGQLAREGTATFGPFEPSAMYDIWGDQL